MKILLVEDNELNRDMLGRRLSRRGFQVTSAVTGRAGVAAARAEAPDLVLLDVGLPDLSGLEVVRLLKGDPDTAAIPVLAVTANAVAEAVTAAEEAGFDGFLTKPVDFARLLGEIARLTGQASAAVPAPAASGA